MLKNKILACLMAISSFLHGQMDNYSYYRELTGISEQWHKIILPDEIFGKTTQDLRDIRIFGITATKDTLEAPYLLRIQASQVSNKEVPFTTLNTSHSADGYYFTFEITGNEPVNQINLNFSNANFDWQVMLEGSHNQTDWFTILDNYRILSVKNQLTDFRFTKLAFPQSDFRYYRVLVKSDENPGLSAASISRQQVVAGDYNNFAIRQIEITENKSLKQTEIAMELNMPLPVCYLKIFIPETVDYYRHVEIKYLTDSVKTEHGWRYFYQNLFSGVLNSLEQNEFQFDSNIAQKLKVIIHNQDNAPLRIDSVQVKGFVHELHARFTANADYFLVYDNIHAYSPQYDIARFAANIPDTLTPLVLGKEIAVGKIMPSPKEPLFKNMLWLWIVIGLIIVILGWFSLKMIKSA
jgi:hypothetical protein